MNFLAHILLSGSDDDILVGNFMGDFVKGSQWKALPERVAQGALLHRFIDFQADVHPISVELRTHLHPVVGKYASVALDMLFDHLLASDFERYAAQSLSSFVEPTYLRLQSKTHLMPPPCRYLFERMKADDWLSSYATYNGLEHAMLRLERRIGRQVGFEHLREVFETEEVHFMNGFQLIFPEIQQRCSEKIVSFVVEGNGFN